jgi:hypothetical protein
VGIDAAEIGGSENVSGLDGVVFGDAEMKKDARAEFAQGIDGENFGLDGGHWGPFFLWATLANTFARTVLFERSAAEKFAILILAAGKTIGQVVVDVKQGSGREWGGWKELGEFEI